VGCITSATCTETHLWEGNGPDNVLGGSMELPHAMVELGRWKGVKVDGTCWHIWGVKVQFHSFLTSALGAGSPHYISNTRLGGPHSWSGHFGEERNILPLSRFERRVVKRSPGKETREIGKVYMFFSPS
jgi:hypothetical protein